VIRVRASVSLCVFKTGFGSGRASEDEEEKTTAVGCCVGCSPPPRSSIPLRCAVRIAIRVFMYGYSIAVVIGIIFYL
jgi:hypothetical protein